MIRRAVLRDVISALDEPGPTACVLTGPPRSGKSWLLRQATRPLTPTRPVFWLRGSELPPPLMVRDGAESLRRQQGEPPEPGSSPAPGDPWSTLADALGDLAGSERRPVLVVDRADAVLEDRRLSAVLVEWWQELRARGRRAHLLMALERPDSLASARAARTGDPVPFSPRVIQVGPLTLREAGAVVPAWGAADLVEVYALVGGLPDFWSRVRGGRSPRANLRRLLLEPGAPLRHLPYLLLGRTPPGPDRQWAVLSAMARGARTWGDIRRDAGVFRSSSELGPYLKALRERGLVEAHRSLDAPPRSRSRRYRLTRPLVESWFGVVQPHLPELDRGDPFDEGREQRMSAAMDSVTRRRIPAVVEQYLRLHGDEHLPGRAREAGGLWGRGYDLPVGGTLETGAAFYAQVSWPAVHRDALKALDRQIRGTRYGFNREGRLRVLVTREPPDHPVTRAAARTGNTWILTARDVAGRA